MDDMLNITELVKESNEVTFKTSLFRYYQAMARRLITTRRSILLDTGCD